jgi:MarR family transcriptional regulator for hemolysin
VSTASTAALLNTLAQRGLIERRPHPRNGRQTLVELTPLAQPIIDAQLPVIHAVVTRALRDVPEADREPLLWTLSLIKTRLAWTAGHPPPKAPARRRPRRQERALP